MSVFNLTGNTDNDTTEQTVNAQQPDTSDKVIIDTDKTNSEQESKIVLDGPLSHIYTQALNIAFAKEGIHTMLAQVMSGDKKNNQTADSKEDNNDLYYRFRNNDEEKRSDLYIYCCDGDKLDQDELVTASNKLRVALDDGKYRKAILAIECNSVVNSKIALLTKYSEAIGASVLYSRKAALEGIKLSIEEFK